MNRFLTQHQPLFRHIFLAEWFLLILALGMSALILPLRHSVAAASLVVSLIMLTLLALLSLTFPDRPGDRALKRVCFIVAEFSLVSLALFSGISTVIMPLYLTVLAKACLLFDGRSRSVILGLCLLAAPICYGVRTNIAYILAQGELPGQLLAIVVCGLLVNVGYIGLMCVVAVWMLSLVNEQQLRQKAERLSGEVEALAQEVERARIAREVHDTLGHSLTSLKLQLEVARRFQGQDEEKARAALSTAEELAARSLLDVRLALKGIRNAECGFSFTQAVDELAKQAKLNERLEVDTDIDRVELPGEIGYQIFRVVQECMTNTLKHADARSVRITASTCNGVLKLIFKDDGKGLPATAGADRYGMKGMEERVQHLRGKLIVESASGKGTQVTVEVPLSTGAAP